MAKRKGKPNPKIPFVWFGSERKTNKTTRAIAKQTLRKGEEPAPEYRTGKFWID